MSHDQVDIDAIFEQHAEQFYETAIENHDLYDSIAHAFLEPEEFYYFCKVTNELEESVIEHAFERLYKFNAELCVTNPVECLRSYSANIDFDYFCFLDLDSDFVEDLSETFNEGEDGLQDVIDRGFETLYAYRADLCVADPVECLRSYLADKQMADEIRRMLAQGRE